MSTDSIETDIHIDASPERVWELITTAEHLGRWFGDAGAEVDLRPGGRFGLHFADHGTYHGRVETVEPPARFAFRWLSAMGVDEPPTPANSTLAEFTLHADGGGTRLVVVESGFDDLGVSAQERTALMASHTEGWPRELADLVAYAMAVR